MTAWVRFCTALLLLSAVAACTDDVALPPVKDSPRLQWSKALKDIATPKGIRVDRLKKHRGVLESYLGWASIHGQHSNSWGESKEDRRISFLINVHNAATLHNILRNDIPDSPDSVKVGPFRWPGAGFYWGTRYKVDKEWSNLNHLAVHDTVNRYAEPLIWMALYDGTRDSPPLRWWTRTKGKLQPQLKRAAKRFVNSKRGMSLNGQTWEVNPLFKNRTSDFIDWTQADNLCEWLAEYATGKREAWLKSKKGTCKLDFRNKNRATDLVENSPTKRPVTGEPNRAP